ncbi:MAG TPA: (Fe-S)-binding protein, partial [bacterium]
TSHMLWLVPFLARLESRMPPVTRPAAWRRALQEAVAPPTSASGASEVTLISGCVMDAAFGPVHAATVRVLARNGIRTRLPEGQGCCGALHLHAGDQEAAVALAKTNIATFETAGDQPILVNSAGCGALLKDYGKLLAHDAAWKQRAERFSHRVLDVSEFVARLPLRSPGHLDVKVAYDDPCHLVHAQKVREPPRQMLGQIPGLTLVALREADMCCGSAGSYSLQHSEMSQRLLQRKLDHIVSSGADIVATGNPGCLLQLRQGARARGLPIRIVHPIELLAEAYDRQ